MMKKARHIARTVFIALLAIGIVSLLSFGTVWTLLERDRFLKDAEKAQEEILAAQMTHIQMEARHVAFYIEGLRSKSQEKMRAYLKERVDEAYAVCNGIYQKNKESKSPRQIGALIKDALREIRFNNGRGYFYALNLDGTQELFADRPELEGMNLKDLENRRGDQVVRSQINLARTRGEGFHKYNWTKPGAAGDDFAKISYVKLFEPLGWVLGTGEYLEEFESNLKEDAIEYIEGIQTKSGEHVFAAQWDGLVLAGPAKGRNMIDVTDPDGVKIVRELIHAARRGGGFVEYVMPPLNGKRSLPKVSYCAPIPDWEWYVGYGEYVEDMEKVAQAKKVVLRAYFGENLKIILLLFFGVLLFAFWFARWFANRMQREFDQFQAFFHTAATQTGAPKMEEKSLRYQEFRTMAGYANQMIGERERVQKELEQSEGYLRSILEAAPAGIGVISGDKLVQVNQLLCRMTGYGQEELLGSDWEMLFGDRVHFEAVARLVSQWREGRGIHSGEQETCWQTKDGKKMDVLLRWAAMNEGDRGSQVTFTVLDITESKQAFSELAHSQKRFQDMAAILPQTIFEMDQGGNFTYLSNEDLGYNQKDIEEGFHAISMVEEEDIPRVVRDMEKVAQGEIADGLEYTGKKKNGELFPVAIYAAPMMEEGRLSGFRGMVMDLTRLKAAEKSLRESEQKYREFIENAPFGMYTLDVEGRFTYGNKKIMEMTGYEAKDWLGKSFHPILHEDDLEEVAKRMEARRKGEELNEAYEVRIHTKAGDTRWVRLLSRSIFMQKETGEREFAGFQTFVEDVTFRKKADEQQRNLERQLRQSQKLEAVGTLAGGIAHDFNNILGIILSYTELLLMKADKDSREYSHLENVRTATLRASDLVKQILTFSRKEESLSHKPFQVVPLIKESLKFLKATLPATIRVRENIDPAPALIQGDPGQVQQVLLNLCTNAQHAIGYKNGVLEVGVETIEVGEGDPLVSHGLLPGHFIDIMVKDDGSGMSDEVSQRLFEPYFTTKGQEEGTGLGLSVVHGIIKSHKGAITVASEQGKGTEFHAYFPALKPQENGRPPDLNELGRVPRGDESILFVDDEEFLAESGAIMLKACGYRVTGMTDPRKALERVQSNPGEFDLVITDLTMPHVTGTDLAAHILEIRPDMPILVCTGFTARLANSAVESLGLKGVLLKPLNAVDMARVVRRVLDG